MIGNPPQNLTIDVTLIAYGLTTTTQQRFAQQLSEIIGIDVEIILAAMAEVTRAELLRVSKNEKPDN